MKLLVLAGGFGTRLQSALDGVPKVLAPIGDQPFLQLQIRHWLDQGVSSMVFLLHHQADQIIDYLQQQREIFRHIEIGWLVEPVAMGTGGAVAYASRELDLTDDFLLVNADTWLGTGIVEMRDQVAPAMAVVKVENAGRFGSVILDTDRRILAFEEKSPESRGGWINAGLFRLNPAVFRGREEINWSLEQSLFPVLAEQGKLKGVPLTTDFIDIGIPDDYFRFCRWIQNRQEGLNCS